MELYLRSHIRLRGLLLSKAQEQVTFRTRNAEFNFYLVVCR